MSKSFLITINGRVQGVGFRPWVYRVAKEHGLKGTVSNDESGVIIYIKGNESNCLDFYESLISDPPPLSRIDGHQISEVSNADFEHFRIVESGRGSNLNLQLTPDFAICDECCSEITDSRNRRFQYPFISCVNCGPRWTITKAFPFERDQTSMNSYQMCPGCLKEYNSPEDRRFHSQTNSCSECGIDYWLTNHIGDRIELVKEEIFEKLAALLKQGQIIAIRNNTGYLLCCDATSAAAVTELRKRKRRPAKPFAVMYPSMKMLNEDFMVSEKEDYWLRSVERPIVILKSLQNKLRLAVEAVAPGLDQMGIMLPYSGILKLLASELDFPIVATSGNMHGCPIIADRDEAQQKLEKVTDYFLHHDLEILNSQDDSVLKISPINQQPILFRRSRGFAPNYPSRVEGGENNPLAMGAQMKSTVGFIPNDYIYLTQYLGVLDNYEVYQRFEETVGKFEFIFNKKPGRILVDAHKGYQATLLGEKISHEFGIPINHIQHHKAHFAAILGEHRLFNTDEPVLGVIWDGTGLGDDNQIWGGEFFTYDGEGMKRRAHFNYYNWLAGDKMAKEPRLSLFSIAEGKLGDLLQSKFTEEELNIYNSLLRNNKLKSSSVGRLFDAVASLLDICDLNGYEGEAPMLLEAAIEEPHSHAFKPYIEVAAIEEIDTKGIISGIYNDVLHRVDRSQIILNFLYTLVKIVFDLAALEGARKICFSGGVFQNSTLVDMLIIHAKEEYELFFHEEISPNDENIAYGQLMYYLNCTDDNS